MSSLFSSQDVVCELIVRNYMKNTKIINQVVPDDLQFVLKRDLPGIKKTFSETYSQKNEQTEFQENLHTLKYTTAENLSREKTFDLYKIEENNLFSIYNKLEEKAKEIGVNVEYLDLTEFSEDDHYNNDHSGDIENKKHAETARSDGKNLILEKELKNAGGIQGRMYDLMHLAFGHMVQWSSDDKKLLLTKEESWAIGYRNHEGSPDIVLEMMSLYEFEAGMQGIEALRQVIDEVDISKEQKERITQYFVDYVYADRDYIIQHYRGNHESFQKFWKFGQNIPPRQTLPKVEKFIKRHAVEIGLIQDKQPV
jgi:hypothetical protein